MKLLAQALLLGNLLVIIARPASAQVANDKALCPLLALPEPLSCVGCRAIEAAIYQRIVLPPECLRYQVIGRVFIRLTIAPAGTVRQVAIVKALAEAFDLAAVKAARQLRFKPRPVKEGAVSFVLAISFQKEIDWLIAHPPHQTTQHRNSTR